MKEGGNVYLCDKKKVMGVYSLELFENQNIKTKGLNLEACKEDIYMQILDWNGDGEAVLEFVPEKSKKMLTGIEMYRSLDYNERVDILNTNHLFQDGRCQKCLHELGERTDEQLDLAWNPKNIIVAIGQREKKDADDYSRIFKKIQIYHKNFIDLLTEDEKNLFRTKAVLLQGKDSDYVELQPKNIIQGCGHKGADYYKGFAGSWKCSECGYYEYHLFTNVYQYEDAFVDPKTILNYPTMFFLRHGMHTSLVIRNNRWAEFLHHKKETKGIATSPLIVLDEKYVEYPELREPEKFEW